MIQRAVDLQVVFFFIFCSFGANNNNIQLQACIILLASTILNAPIIHHTPHQTSSSRRRHLPYTHDKRHSPTNEHRVATFPARTVPWLSIGLVFRNAHLSHGAVKRHLPPLSVFTREQQMVVRVEHVQKRAGRGVRRGFVWVLGRRNTREYKGESSAEYLAEAVLGEAVWEVRVRAEKHS